MDYLFNYTNSPPILIPFATIIIALLIKYTYGHALRSVFKKTKTDIDDQIIKSLENPIFWSILLFGSFLFFNQLSFSSAYLISISNLIKTLAVIVWLFTAIRISTILIVAIATRQKHSDKLVDIIPMLKTIAKLAILGVALTITFEIWGIDITPVIASAGIAGVAIAFAAKDTVSNLFGGISVFFDRPYAVKDYVIIDEKYRGEVIEIGIRSTKIKTRDDVLLTVPNSVMITKAVINETGLDGKLRVRVPIGIAQGTDLDKAEDIIVKILSSHTEVLKDPKPKVRYRRFGEETINLEALFVISNPASRGRITHELIKKLDKGLRKASIDMPPPKMVITLDQDRSQKVSFPS